MVDALLRRQSLQRLAATLDFWTQRQGMRFVDLPWSVPACYLQATRPPGAPDAALDTHYGQFVCSGEQSFMALWDQGLLPDAAGYIGWTPCIRNEPLDDLHQYGFMKAELFSPAISPEDGLAGVMAFTLEQRRLFRELAQVDYGIDILPALGLEQVASDQWDILLGGIEIGSYGIRTFKEQLYVYGTALAEPRFSIAVERLLQR